MNTSCNKIPNEWVNVINKSWVKGRGGITPSKAIAIDCASVVPTIIGIRWGPFSSARSSA